MTTDEKAEGIVRDALGPWGLDPWVARHVIEELNVHGIELFEAAPAQKESQ